MRDAAQGDDLVAALGTRTAVLMRGHGCVATGADVRQAVFAAIYLERNAALLATALGLGEVRSLSVAKTQRAGAMLRLPSVPQRPFLTTTLTTTPRHNLRMRDTTCEALAKRNTC